MPDLLSVQGGYFIRFITGIFISIMTTRQTGGLLWGYKPLLLNSRLKALGESFLVV